jgi:hypothetical protein
MLENTGTRREAVQSFSRLNGPQRRRKTLAEATAAETRAAAFCAGAAGLPAVMRDKRGD